MRRVKKGVDCLQCGRPAIVTALMQRPGGRRLGSETLVSLNAKECECDWGPGEAAEALVEKVTGTPTKLQ